MSAHLITIYPSRLSKLNTNADNGEKLYSFITQDDAIVTEDFQHAEAGRSLWAIVFRTFGEDPFGSESYSYSFNYCNDRGVTFTDFYYLGQGEDGNAIHNLSYGIPNNAPCRNGILALAEYIFVDDLQNAIDTINNPSGTLEITITKPSTSNFTSIKIPVTPYAFTSFDAYNSTITTSTGNTITLSYDFNDKCFYTSEPTALSDYNSGNELTVNLGNISACLIPLNNHLWCEKWDMELSAIPTNDESFAYNKPDYCYISNVVTGSCYGAEMITPEYLFYKSGTSNYDTYYTNDDIGMFRGLLLNNSSRWESESLDKYFTLYKEEEEEEPTIYDVNNINEAFGLDDDWMFTMFNDCVVTCKLGKYLFIRDSEDNSGAIYLGGSSNEESYTNGDVLADGWTATLDFYRNYPEFINPEGLSTNGETRPAEPFERVPEYISIGEGGVGGSIGNLYEYVIFKGVTIYPDPDNPKYFYIVTGSGNFLLYNIGKLLIPSIEDDKLYDVVCVIFPYNAEPIGYIVELTESAVTDPDTPGGGGSTGGGEDDEGGSTVSPGDNALNLNRGSYFDQTFVPIVTRATSPNYTDPVYNTINKDRGFLDGLFWPTILNGHMFEYETSADGTTMTVNISALNYDADEIYNILINDDALPFVDSYVGADEEHYSIKAVDFSTLEICCLESQTFSFVNSVLYILSKILVYKEGEAFADGSSLQEIHDYLLYTDDLGNFTGVTISSENGGSIDIQPFSSVDISATINILGAFGSSTIMKPVNILEVDPSFIYQEEFTKNIPNSESNILFLEFFRGGNSMPASYRRMFYLIFKYICKNFGLQLCGTYNNDINQEELLREIENIIIATGEVIDVADLDFAIFENQAYMLEYDNLFSRIFQAVRETLIGLEDFFGDVCSGSFGDMMDGNSIPQTILNEELAPSVSYESHSGAEYSDTSPWKMTLRTVRNDSSINSLIDEIYKAIIDEVDDTHYYYGISNNMTNTDSFINAYNAYKSGDIDELNECLRILESNYILMPLAFVPIVVPCSSQLDFVSEEEEYPIDANLNILNWFETSFGWFNFMENNDISSILIPI